MGVVKFHWKWAWSSKIFPAVRASNNFLKFYLFISFFLGGGGGGSRRMSIYYSKVSTHAHRIIRTPLLKILDPPLVKSILWGVKWFSYPLSKVKRKRCVYNHWTGPLDWTGLLDWPLDSKQHTKWWGITSRCIYLVYEIVPTIDRFVINDWNKSVSSKCNILALIPRPSSGIIQDK